MNFGPIDRGFPIQQQSRANPNVIGVIENQVLAYVHFHPSSSVTHVAREFSS